MCQKFIVFEFVLCTSISLPVWNFLITLSRCSIYIECEQNDAAISCAHKCHHKVGASIGKVMIVVTLALPQSLHGVKSGLLMQAFHISNSFTEQLQENMKIQNKSLYK